MALEIGIALHDSEIYKETVALRYKILRKPLGLNFTEAQLKAEVSDFHVFAKSNNAVCGCMVLSPLANEEIKMRQVAVDSIVQNQGIGTKMVHFAEEWAREKGYKKMVLHAREHAIPFYLKHHYNIEGGEFEEVGIPHHKMFKWLTS